MDDVDFDDSSVLFSKDEIDERDELLKSAATQDEADVIADLYERIAVDREQDINARRPEETATASNEPVTKRHPIANFKFRDGMDDKRAWGLPLADKAAAAALKRGLGRVDMSAGSPAADGAAPMSPVAGSAAGTGSSSAKTAAEVAAASLVSAVTPAASPNPTLDPLESLALATSIVFAPADLASLSPADLDARYAEHAHARAKIEWSTLESLKKHGTYGVLYNDTVAVLKDARLPLSAEGLASLHLADKAGKKAALAGAKLARAVAAKEEEKKEKKVAAALADVAAEAKVEIPVVEAIAVPEVKP